MLKRRLMSTNGRLNAGETSTNAEYMSASATCRQIPHGLNHTTTNVDHLGGFRTDWNGTRCSNTLLVAGKICSIAVVVAYVKAFLRLCLVSVSPPAVTKPVARGRGQPLPLGRRFYEGTLCAGEAPEWSAADRKGRLLYVVAQTSDLAYQLV